MEHENDGDTSCDWRTWNDPHRIDKGAGRVGNRRMNRDYPNYSIVNIGWNTEKSPGVLGRVIVTQTPVKYHQPTLV